MGLALGPRLPRLAPRVLGDEHEATWARHFDIHTGGVDHIPVHHTNEIAQSECALDVHPWVRFWMHNEFLDLGGEKISKSKGHVLRCSDLVDRGLRAARLPLLLPAGALPPAADLHDEAMEAAATGYRRLLRRGRGACARRSGDAPIAGDAAQPYRARFREAVRDDLNAPRALAVAWEVARSDDARRGASAARCCSSSTASSASASRRSVPRAARQRERSAHRRAGRGARRPRGSGADFAAADRIRDALTARGHRDRGHAGRAALATGRAVSSAFELVSEFKPQGDQPRAIERARRRPRARRSRTRRCSASRAAASPSRWPASSSG